MSLVLRYSNWFVTAILLLVGNRVLFVTLRGVLTPDSSGEKERSRPWCRQQLPCCLSLPRWEQFAGKLGDGHWDCDLCLERICHHFFVVARSETQSCGLRSSWCF